MIRFILAALLLVLAIPVQAQQVEQLRSQQDRELYMLMAFEAVAGTGLKCTWRRRSGPSIEINSSELALMLQVSDLGKVTRSVEGDLIKVRIHATPNKGDMEKKNRHYPFTDIFIDVEANALVMTPSRMMFHIVAIEEGYITDRFIECL